VASQSVLVNAAPHELALDHVAPREAQPMRAARLDVGPPDDLGALQAALLPRVPERIGPTGISVAYRPAEGPAAGGDFYDVFALADDRVAVMVGDISGHGRSALPQTALIRYTLRTYLDSGLGPRAALAAAGAALDHQLDRCFATVVLAVLDTAERTLTYACAGHPPPLVLAPQPLAPVLAAASPPIGAGLATGLRQTVISLPAAASVCFFTDGLVEARARGRLYGAGRLAAALAAIGPRGDAAELLELVIARTDKRPDDMAACLLRLDGPRAPEPATAHALTLSEELELSPRDLRCGRAEAFLLACSLPRARATRALKAARLVVGSAGAAVLQVVRDRDKPHAPPSVEVSPPRLKILHLHKRLAALAPVEARR
jgi:hypothetical protein